MNTCSVDGCNRTVLARNLCRKHYNTWLASTQGACSIDGCDGIVQARGWCSKHYKRWQMHGNPLVSLQSHADRGAPREFIEMAINHQDNKECLFWPFARNNNGYAVHDLPDKDSRYVSRIICETIYGPPLTPKHEACHNCGQGHLGCVNPHHLRWGTHTRNQKDRTIHGTDSRGEQNGQAMLTREQVQEIRTLHGTLSGYKVAAIFGVSHTTIYYIWQGKTWKE